MDLKILSENIAADADLSSKNDSLFQHYRDSFKGLERKEPPQDDAKVFRLQQKVNREINISKHWYPPESWGLMSSEENKNQQPPQPPIRKQGNDQGNRSRVTDSLPSKVQPVQEWPQPERNNENKEWSAVHSALLKEDPPKIKYYRDRIA